MRHRTRITYTAFVTVALWVAFVPAAHAYLDPGSTSVIFSAVVAGLAAAGTVVASFRSRIAGFLRRDRGEHVDDPAAPEPGEQ